MNLRLLTIACLFASTLFPQSMAVGIVPFEELSGKSKVMVLATPHLTDYKEEFNADALEPVIKALEMYKPEIICLEIFDNMTIERLKAQGPVMEPVLDMFATEIRALQESCKQITGLEPSTAASRVNELLSLPQLSTEERQELVLCFGAAGERMSALLQYAYLKDDAADASKLPATLVNDLDQQLNSCNERISLGIALAKRLGLQRLYGVDDHSDKDIYVGMMAEFEQEITSSPEIDMKAIEAFQQKSDDLMRRGFKSGSVLDGYLYFNSREYAEENIKHQWALFQQTGFESKNDRIRLALWDIRNSNIAANVRRAMTSRPGANTLVIIGASHKVFLDDILNTYIDVKVTEFNDLLREDQK